MRVCWIAAIAVGASFAGGASASDRTGYQAIATGDLVAAERTLVAERRIHPGRPELMLNLAAVYARTGRLAEARALLSQAADARTVAVDMPDGSVASSRQLAIAGLSTMGGMQVATR